MIVCICDCHFYQRPRRRIPRSRSNNFPLLRTMRNAPLIDDHSKRQTCSLNRALDSMLQGLAIAAKVGVTELPQLVAAFHSLVGIAAVATAFSSLLIEAGHKTAISLVHQVRSQTSSFAAPSKYPLLSRHWVHDARFGINGICREVLHRTEKGEIWTNPMHSAPRACQR
jgi:hypothetical protein